MKRTLAILILALTAAAAVFLSGCKEGEEASALFEGDAYMHSAEAEGAADTTPAAAKEPTTAASAPEPATAATPEQTATTTAPATAATSPASPAATSAAPAATTTPATTTTTARPTTTTPATTTTKPATTSAPPPATVTTSPPPVTVTTAETAAPSADFETRVVELVNIERAKGGLAPLTQNAALSDVARLKSKDMQSNGYFDHTSPTYGSPFDMMKSFGISYRAAGENIAYGYRTPEAVVEGWMNSEGHRRNIMSSSFTEIGVGYISQGNYWTQMFIG